MSFTEFQSSLQESTVPQGLGSPLQGLWHDGKGEWEKAHRRVQDDASTEAAWVHAYLHRKEGDASNAAYWYARARRPEPKTTLEEEWADIARELLEV
jgi:hypothetical protein|uniref:hypothetical protein n=1 Tax=Cephaloticoccus sp. TaxID=1985742 RepID=UPI00404ADB9C